MTAHAKLGASKADRWLNCPGTIQMCQNIPQSTSKFAAEGTQAHELGEKILKGVNFSDQEYSLEMLEYTQIYTDYVNNLDVDEKHIEKKVRIEHGTEDLFGTVDFLGYSKKLDMMYVVDLKYGKGVIVDAVKNRQLMYYAAGAMHALNMRPQFVKIVIVQPRVEEPIKEWITSATDLRAWLEYELYPGVEKVYTNPYLKAGSHCRFCPAKSFCDEYENIEKNRRYKSDLKIMSKIC